MISISKSIPYAWSVPLPTSDRENGPVQRSPCIRDMARCRRCSQSTASKIAGNHPLNNMSASALQIFLPRHQNAGAEIQIPKVLSAPCFTGEGHKPLIAGQDAIRCSWYGMQHQIRQMKPPGISNREKIFWRLWQGTLLPEAQEGRRRLKAGLNAPKYVNLCMQPFNGSKKHPGACIGEQTVQPVKKGTLLPEAHLQGTAGQEPA